VYKRQGIMPHVEVLYGDAAAIYKDKTGE